MNPADEPLPPNGAADEPLLPNGAAGEPLPPDGVAGDDVSADGVPPESAERGTAPAADLGPEVADESAQDAPAGAVDEAAQPTDLRAALEAILLVVDEPVAEVLLAQILEVPTERIAVALTGLSHEYTSQGRGFDLRRAAGGWRLYTRPAYAPYVERFVLDGQQTRLTQAALETLAVVAYKQPVTRSRISAIRGVNCDGVIRTLLTRGLIEERGIEPENGAHLYGTTTLFLEKLGLDSTEELPPLAPFLPNDLEALAETQE